MHIEYGTAMPRMGTEWLARLGGSAQVWPAAPTLSARSSAFYWWSVQRRQLIATPMITPTFAKCIELPMCLTK